MSQLKYVDAVLLENVYRERGIESFHGARYEQQNPRELVEEYAEEIGVDLEELDLEGLEERDPGNWERYKHTLENVKDSFFLEEEY